MVWLLNRRILLEHNTKAPSKRTQREEEFQSPETKKGRRREKKTDKEKEKESREKSE
jgi:hypothetical protein